MEQQALRPDYRDFDRWVLEAARNPKMSYDKFAARSAEERADRVVDRWALARAKMLAEPKNARQYFNSQIADSLIVAASITPTTTKTFIFTQAQANQAFPIGYGLAAPFAGQVYKFAMGGLITTPATGTLIIDPVHGNGATTTTGGTDMGASAAQTVTASLSNSPWIVEGYLVYRSISAVLTTSTAWLTGAFMGQGTLATAGLGWVIPFGSTAAVSVDTTGTGTAGTFGALNFYVTFSVTGGTISAQWTSMQSLN